MSNLTARTFQEEFHKSGVVNTRSENLRGKADFVETHISNQIVIVGMRVSYKNG